LECRCGIETGEGIRNERVGLREQEKEDQDSERWKDEVRHLPPEPQRPSAPGALQPAEVGERTERREKRVAKQRLRPAPAVAEAVGPG
jgi:hypothetical protein